MSNLVLPQPEHLFTAPAEMIDAMEQAAEPDHITVLAYPILDKPGEEYYWVWASNQELWEAGRVYAKHILEQAPGIIGPRIMMMLRKLVIGPHQKPDVADANRGWHTDEDVYVSVANEIPTEYLVGSVDRVKAAKQVGKIMLKEAKAGSRTHKEQIKLLNLFERAEDIPGEVIIYRPQPLEAVRLDHSHAHRRPLVNPTDETVARIFINAQTYS